METLPEMLKSWKWSVRVYRDSSLPYPVTTCVWEWTRGTALMPLPDRCAVKMGVGTDAVTIRIFNRAIPGDIDSRNFYIHGYGGRKIEDRFSAPEIDLSKFRLDEFCGDIEKYIQFFMPSTDGT